MNKKPKILSLDAYGRYLPTHGMRNTSEYESWHSMKTRCHTPNHVAYPKYGGSGIIVCDRWRNSFENFIEDMGMKPTPKHTLDRYPNRNGNYEPGNCRWATYKEQNRNRKSNRPLTFNGETKCQSEWAEITGITKEVINYRIKHGWSVNDTLTKPVQTNKL